MEKKQSLKKTITIMVLSFTCLPFLFFGTYYNFTFSNTLTKNAENFLTTSMEIVKRDIERNFQFTNDTSMNFLADKLLRQYLIDYISTNNPYKRNQLKYEIERQLQFALNFNSLWREKLINTIFVFVDENNYFSIIRDIPNNAIVATHKRLFIESASMEGQYLFAPSQHDPKTIYFIRMINDLEQFKPIGKMILSLDSSKLNEIDNTLIGYSNVKTFTFSDDGTVFFHSDSMDIGRNIDPSIFDQRNRKDIFEYTLDDEIYYMQISKIKDYDLYTGISIPKKQVLGDAAKTERNYLITVFIVLFLSILLGAIISSKIVKPLIIITQTSKRIGEGNFQNKLPDFRYKELNQLSTGFNRMIEKVDFLINQVYKKQLLLQEAELKMLQSQVNPHFLFNVLDTISWEAIMNGQGQIHTMLNSLAELIRRNIVFSHQEIISISEELKYINYYLQLQQFRFEDKLSVKISLGNDAIKTLCIPKLSIQPFIDNAIVHGIELKDSMGHVEVNLYTKDDQLICEIVDDGVGFDMTKDRIKHKDDSKHNHIGIINVKKRIRLLFGNRNGYGVEIDSTSGEGTRVIIILPIVKDGEWEHVQSNDC